MAAKGLLTLALAGGLGIALGQEDAGGLDMRFYRNFFSGSMNPLVQMDEDGEAPFRLIALSRFQAVSPWNEKRTENLARLYALVVCGSLVPDQDGEYELSALCNGTMRFFLSTSANEADCREIAFEKVERSKSETAGGQSADVAFAPNMAAAATVSLKGGTPYFVKVLFLPGWKDSLAVGWRLKGDPEPPRIIPGGNLRRPAPKAFKSPVAAVSGLSPNGWLGATGDEPDQLSWELISMDQTLIRDFFDWAKRNPPPAVRAEPPPAACPYVWIKAGELTTDNPAWRAEPFGEQSVLRGPGSHNFRDKGNAFIDIPREGHYRLWVRHQHAQGKNETFTLQVFPAAKGDSAQPDIESKLARFNQSFGLSYEGRSTDPIPDVSTVETPPSGFLWEGSHRTAFLRPGRHRLHFSGGIYPNRPDLKISDLVFTTDPLYVPTDADMPASSGSGERPPCDELVKNWTLFCARPGASNFDAAPSALRASWMRWRGDLIDKLATLEYSDYVWGYLASLVYFDEESNLIGRPAEVKRQKELDARPDTTFVVAGNEFRNVDSENEDWKESPFYRNSYGVPDNIAGPAHPSEAAAYHDFDIPADGRYVVWVQYYHNGGYRMCPTEVSVFAGDVLVKQFETPSESGTPWVNGGLMALKKGRARIQLKAAKPSFKDGSGRLGGPCIAQCVLTRRTEFSPRRAVEYPDGRRVGDGATGFWFSEDPWAGFTRYSRPGSFDYSPYVPAKWTLLPEQEINKGDFAFEAKSGEVVSQLFVLRNNTDAPIAFKPAIELGAIPASARIVASTLTASGFWSPMLLLKRNEVIAPPRQNTGLWLTIDCRGISEGVYTGTLEAAGHRVALKVEVKGSLAGAPVPHVYPYAVPYATKSCWEAFRDLGINMVSFCHITKGDMDAYGIVNQVGIPSRADSEETVRAGVALAERLGLASRDYCWYLIDEPGSKQYPKWLEMAKTLRAVDPELLIWCNLGGWAPGKESLPLLLEMMDYWDVSCPYQTQFGVNAKDRDYDAYVEKLVQVGKIRLLYETPDIGDTEKLFWAPKALLEVGAKAQGLNRTGWAFFSLRYGPPFDDVYVDNRDYAVSIYPGARGATLLTRNAEAIRESVQRWKQAKLDDARQGDERKIVLPDAKGN